MNVFRFIVQRKNIAPVRSIKFCPLSVVVDVKSPFKWSRSRCGKLKEIGQKCLYSLFLFGRVVWASSIVRLSTSVDKWNRTKDALKKTPQTFDLGDATWLRVQLGCAKGGNFIYPMMHRFMLYYQASKRTWCYQFNGDVTVEQQWKATCFADKTFLYLCCVDLFTIFVLLFEIYLLLSQRDCFGRRLCDSSQEGPCFSSSCFNARW